ncbi:DUF4397 domain-containing protein [Silvimonas sp.]|uniref:DUF4397 domain-containing protein n=1 Tax=Silvimonas sp. TaxID=2650811 RepID=UPI00283E03A8|nr:DUF4397 domain-containing protein [Silvimonas sp.]MDR3428081.1 DUF4397 domain-containing protein [Silvimonas sp.]
MTKNASGWCKKMRRLTLPELAVAALLCLALSFSLSGCTNVATYTQPTLVRVIDASYTAPAINVYVEGSMVAGNVGQGTITPYGTLTASPAAAIKVTGTTTTTALLSTSGILLTGHQHSVFLTDDSTTGSGYAVTVLEDQQVGAASGHSAFRFLNQAAKTGAVDVYMIPADSTLAKSIPLITALPVGSRGSYVSFTSQTVTMVITPTGSVTPKYTSTPIALTGGEVRTVLLVNAQLTSDPPVDVTIGNDVN